MKSKKLIFGLLSLMVSTAAVAQSENNSFLSSDSIVCPIPDGRELTEIRGKLYQGNEPMEGLAACIDVKYHQKTATVRLHPLTNSFVMSVPRKAELVFKVLGHEDKVMRVQDIKNDSVVWEKPPRDNNLYIVFGKVKERIDTVAVAKPEKVKKDTLTAAKDQRGLY